MFEGFSQDMISFFMDLRFHNNKAFMDENRERYLHTVREPFYHFIEELGPKMQKIDPDFEIRPHKCLSRINRDVRFSRDKSPYRDHLWLAFRRAGAEKDGSPFYWFEVSPENINWGVGLWGENRNALDTMRRRMEADPRPYEAIFPCMLEADFDMSGQDWKKISVPPALSPALRSMYVKRSIYFSKLNPRFHWLYQKTLVNRVYRDFLTMAPAYYMLRGIANDRENA